MAPLEPLSSSHGRRCDCSARPDGGRVNLFRNEESDVSDVVFLVLTVALFAALALVVRGVDKL